MMKKSQSGVSKNRSGEEDPIQGNRKWRGVQRALGDSPQNAVEGVANSKSEPFIPLTTGLYLIRIIGGILEKDSRHAKLKKTSVQRKEPTVRLLIKAKSGLLAATESTKRRCEPTDLLGDKKKGWLCSRAWGSRKNENSARTPQETRPRTGVSVAVHDCWEE